MKRVAVFSLLVLATAVVISVSALASVDVRAACSSKDPDSQALAAGIYLESGIDAYGRRDFERAEADWLAATKCSKSAPSWPKAIFNLGLVQMERKNYPRAIAYFEQVIQSHPNDAEPGSHLMQTNQNYSHRSALEISVCYENMGDYRKALEFARLAKNRYTYVSWCGTCQMTDRRQLQARIAYLNMRVTGGYVLSVLVFGGVIIGWRRHKKHSLALQ